MMAYMFMAGSVWFIGFFPFAEIYVAVPAGLAMGLDPYSVVVWSVAGNYLPILLIHLSYERMLRIPRVGPWMLRLPSPKVKDRLDRYGFWFIALTTPWIGVWVVAVSMKVLGMDGRTMLLSTFVGVAGYAVVIAALIVAGVNLVW